MQKYVIALYIRLSIEDYKYDSLSIENQSLVLHEYAASMPEALNAEIMEFIDNGYSGTNFERPQVQKLIELVRANQIDCIIVKDFSRFGRNSIETGYFIERVFPLFHTRFISISDDFDSSKFKGDTGGMDVAFKYLISEYYSRDMSIKTKSAKYAKMQRGEYQSKICPYGYRKIADGRMEPDPEAAAVVQLIFQLAAEGINATAITRELFRRSIPTPGQYKAAHGNHTHDISRCHGIWSASTILRILEDERYTGVYKLAGISGALVAIIATILPPFLILTVLSFLYERFRSNLLLSQLLAGMQAGVGAVIASVVWDMGTDAVRQKNTVSIGIMLGAFLAACFFHVNVVYIILCCIVLGIVRTLLARRRNRR